MTTRMTTAPTFVPAPSLVARVTAAVIDAWADCSYASRRIVELEGVPADRNL